MKTALCFLTSRMVSGVSFFLSKEISWKAPQATAFVEEESSPTLGVRSAQEGRVNSRPSNKSLFNLFTGDSPEFRLQQFLPHLKSLGLVQLCEDVVHYLNEAQSKANPSGHGESLVMAEEETLELLRGPHRVQPR